MTNTQKRERQYLRDEFARAALMGILSDPDTKIGQPVAEYAYKMADLMLAERDKK